MKQQNKKVYGNHQALKPLRGEIVIWHSFECCINTFSCRIRSCSQLVEAMVLQSQMMGQPSWSHCMLTTQQQKFLLVCPLCSSYIDVVSHCYFKENSKFEAVSLLKQGPYEFHSSWLWYRCDCDHGGVKSLLGLFKILLNTLNDIWCWCWLEPRMRKSHGLTSFTCYDNYMC